jgi:hypothetical protein
MNKNKEQGNKNMKQEQEQTGTRAQNKNKERGEQGWAELRNRHEQGIKQFQKAQNNKQTYKKSRLTQRT